VNILEQFEERAKKNPKRIVFPEGTDDRILKAAHRILELKTAQPIILGNSDSICSRAKELGLSITNEQVFDPSQSTLIEEFAQSYFELRKHKGLTIEQAREAIRHPTTFGTMMVYLDHADGLVSGATHTTAETLRPALQIIKTKEAVPLASSFFIMVTPEKVFFFADCGFVKNPNAKELAAIAITTADSAKRFGFDPYVALLSFSTKGSADDPSIQKVREATQLVRQQRPDILIDGELQVDAAIVDSVAHKKCPDSPVGGKANVLIFPDLNSGNIGYKLVERFAHTRAIGPIVQGLHKPINDLSRGCSVQDIVDITAITVIEAQK